MTADATSETDRRRALVAAERKALGLFDAIEANGLLKAGRSERDVEQDIYEIALKRFGVEKYWHKRIVRSGPNTLTIAADNPPVRTIDRNDIVSVDLGPVFEDSEADIGRTYVLGDHPGGRLVADLPVIFERVRRHYHAHPDITGAELYAFAQMGADDAGWVFGGKIAGHLISEFAHAHVPGEKTLTRIAPENPEPMRNLDELGRVRHWILEIHLVDRAGAFGGFYERLL
jgi:Xaa-Pro dipeptidase